MPPTSGTPDAHQHDVADGRRHTTGAAFTMRRQAVTDELGVDAMDEDADTTTSHGVGGDSRSIGDLTKQVSRDATALVRAWWSSCSLQSRGPEH
jgi:hypothetical protein